MITYNMKISLQEMFAVLVFSHEDIFENSRILTLWRTFHSRDIFTWQGTTLKIRTKFSQSECFLFYIYFPAIKSSRLEVLLPFISEKWSHLRTWSDCVYLTFITSPCMSGSNTRRQLHSDVSLNYLISYYHILPHYRPLAIYLSISLNLGCHLMWNFFFS